MARGYLVGLQRVMIWTIEQSGTYKGMIQGTGSSLANGSVGAAYVISDAKSANLAAVAVASIDIEGGDRIVASPTFGGGKTAAFELTSSAFDSTVQGMVSGAAENVDDSYFTYGSYNYNRSQPRVVGCAVQQRYELSTGDLWFFTRVFPACAVTYSVGQAAFRVGTDTTINVSPINTTKGLDGRSFGTGGYNFGLQDDTADQYYLISQYPVHFLVYKSDASATTFNTTYKPISTVVTVNASPNRMVKNLTPTALTSMTLAGLGTLAAAGSAGDRHVLQYQNELVPV